MTISTEDVLNKRVGRLYVHYLLPTLFATLMGSLYTFADLLFVGNGVGGEALAALSIATPMYSIFSCLTCLIGLGGANVMAICAGEQNEEEANQVFTQSMLLLLGIGILLTAGFQIFLGPISRFLGADDTLLPLVESYMRIVTLATPGFLINWSIGNFIRNDGNPNLVMWSSLIPNLFNIVFDYVFVFPLGMGIQGAALATALSPVLGLLIQFSHFALRKNHLRFVRPRFSWARLWRTCRNGASYFAQELSGAVAVYAYNSILMALGGSVMVSAYSVVMNIGWISMGLISGFIGGAVPIIGICVGAGRYDRVHRAFRLAVVSGGVFAAAASAALLLFPEAVGSLFAGGDPAVIQAAGGAGRLYYWGILPAWLNMMVLGLAQASEWNRQALLISLSRSLVMLMLCLLGLSSLFGLPGAWLSFVAAELLTAVLSLLIWRQLRSVPRTGPVPEPKAARI